MGSKQSQPLDQQNASVNSSISSISQGNESPAGRESNDTNTVTGSKLPFNHPSIDSQTNSEKECPYKKNPFKGVQSMFRKSSSQSTTIPQEEEVSSSAPSSTTAAAAAANTSGCPVKHTSRPDANQPSSSSGGCPVSTRNSSKAVAYNVYSQPIDPTNQMPAVANQLPAPMQRKTKYRTNPIDHPQGRGGWGRNVVLPLPTNVLQFSGEKE
jgi:hypothetical protein